MSEPFASLFSRPMDAGYDLVSRRPSDGKDSLCETITPAPARNEHFLQDEREYGLCALLAGADEDGR